MNCIWYKTSPPRFLYCAADCFVKDISCWVRGPMPRSPAWGPAPTRQVGSPCDARWNLVLGPGEAAMALMRNKPTGSGAYTGKNAFKCVGESANGLLIATGFPEAER